MNIVRAAAVLVLPVCALGVWALNPPQPGHRPLHIACPPGSHTSPSSKNAVARQLEEARARSVTARSLTAGHPAASNQPNAPK